MYIPRRPVNPSVAFLIGTGGASDNGDEDKLGWSTGLAAGAAGLLGVVAGRWYRGG